MRKLTDLFSFTALLGATFLVAAIVPMLAAHPAGAADDPGKAVFVAQKCNMCHSVDSQQIAQTSKMAGGDLSNVGATRDQAWITEYLKKATNGNNGKPHGKEWKGTDAELGQVAAWLAGLKK
jgi:cbb3-type cytochrome oxidase cytochrome c subunit